MSSSGTNVIQTIETDLKNAGDWLYNTVVGTTLAVWNIVKIAFEVATNQQAQVIIDVFNKLQADAIAGKDISQIETDLLNVATADELAILQEAGSEIIQGFIAFMQANQKLQAAKAAKAAKGG